VGLDDPLEAVLDGAALDLARDLAGGAPQQGAGTPAVLVRLAPQDAAESSQ
jgi:hypothetical protein